MKHKPESRNNKLGDLCRSRWVQRPNARETIQKLHKACMETICDKGPKKWSSNS